MTEKQHFKIPAVRRAIRAAHGQQLIVESYRIHPDGSIEMDATTNLNGTGLYEWR